MIGWPDIAPVLLEQFTLAVKDRTLGDAGFSAQWWTGKVGFISDLQRFSLDLKMTRLRGIGEDETRTEFDEGSETLAVSQTGQRAFTIQASVIYADRSDDFFAMTALDRLRTRLRRRSAIDAMLAVGVAFASFGDAIKAPFKDGGRWLNAAVMDVNLLAVVNDVVETPDGGEWIDAVEITSHVEGVDGIELPVPPNVVEDLIPADWTPPDP